jgi:hypothetical protein
VALIERTKRRKLWQQLQGGDDSEDLKNETGYWRGEE